MSGLPLNGIKILEFTHAVMGPCAGVILADLGAEVIHIEPPTGDTTRKLKGFGTGYFTFFNRNKKSLAIDIKAQLGKDIIYQLARNADILIENFGPGTMQRLGFGYEQMRTVNERLIYCSLKGFMPGPYEHRHAMDEVVQMMGGLAYMTGRSGDPLRAGSSVIDITGGMFGVIGILAALHERNHTGKGRFIQSSLFETTAFLMGQHMAYGAITQQKVPPMPERVSAWSIYRIFKTRDEKQIFIGIISDKHWERFCVAFQKNDWLEDARLRTNEDRIDQRGWFVPAVEQLIAHYTQKELETLLEEADIPFANIACTEDLFSDKQLNETGFLTQTRLPDDRLEKLPKTPILIDDQIPDLRLQPPKVGEHTIEILTNSGFGREQINQLLDQQILTSHYGH